MCTAVNFSNRVLYALYLRLILSFRITESKSSPAETNYIAYKRDPSESNAMASAFKVKLTPREEQSLDSCLVEAQERLSDFNIGQNTESLVV